MAIAEDQLRQQLAGRTFYLRGGYLENTLHFNERGDLDGSSPKASYTLSLVQIDRVKVDKHHVELVGARYGLHFLGAMASDDQSANVDRVQLTSKKKPLRITIDRELVVKPKAEKPDKKKEKEKRTAKQTAATAKPALAAAAPAQPQAPSTATDPAAAAPLVDAPTPSQGQPAVADSKPETGVPPQTTPDQAGQAQTAQVQTAQARPASRSLIPFFGRSDADRNPGAFTSSQEESDRMLRTAIDHIFSPSIDDRMVETLPDYWKLYYKAVAEKSVYRPSNPAVLRVTQVDQKPRLTTGFEPSSNEYAQNNGVAGMAMYHVIVGTDGKPQEVAIGRPIGFGLDENAVESIRKASFEPGMKDGKPVPVEVDLTVQFRIYSKRTAGGANEATTENPAPKAPTLPGPYSVNQPNLNQPQ
jgi:TonB family protein